MNDLTGRRFGRLVAVRTIGKNSRRNYIWCCRCDCGNEVAVVGINLTSGNSRSCGCLHRQKSSLVNTIHGLSDSPEYSTWTNMKTRCLNTRNPSHPRYGGRGIMVCQRWMTFKHFLADMGPKPGPGFSIERINNSKGYYPENCVWATASQQAKNRRPKQKTQ